MPCPRTQKWPGERREPGSRSDGHVGRRDLPAPRQGALCPSETPPAELAHRRQEIVAGLLASVANLGTDSAVLVISRVEAALVGAGNARRRAGLDRGPYDSNVGHGLPDHDSTRCVTELRTVQSEADAARHLARVVLAQTVVGTGSTARRAVQAGLDTAKHRLAIEIARVRMQHDDFLIGHAPPFHA